MLSIDLQHTLGSIDPPCVGTTHQKGSNMQRLAVMENITVALE